MVVFWLLGELREIERVYKIGNNSSEEVNATIQQLLSYKLKLLTYIYIYMNIAIRLFLVRKECERLTNLFSDHNGDLYLF